MDQPLGGNSQAPTALAAPERNQYFQGELLDVPHLQLEQGYLNAKRWLMNRLINGSGVVTGLAVAPAAGGTQLVVQAGIAIDGWGREIVVPSQSVPFDPRLLTGDDGSPSGTVSGSGFVTISICYQECGIDASPGITREKYSVRVQGGTTVSRPVTCGFGDDVSGIYAALASRINQPYVDPSGQGCVLLAQVNLPASGALTDSIVDNTVRPVVVNTELLLELVFSLAQRVQQLEAGSTRA
jgi:hypothetical protein